MEKAQYPIVVIEVGDICIRSVLDDGFTRESSMAPEVHSHAFYELILAIEGEFCIELRDRSAPHGSHLMREGSACLIPPGVYHLTREISDMPKKLALRFTFTAASETSLSPSVLDAFSRTLSACLAPTLILDGGELCDIIKEIQRELNSDGIASAEYVRLLFGQLYIKLLRALNGSRISEQPDKRAILTTADADSRQIRIEEYLYSHFSEPVTEDDLAREMNLSKRQLSRVLGRLFGTSFRQLLIDIRLNRAAQLLSDTDMSVEEVAYAVGYMSLSGFYSAFRAKFSVSVGRYRQRALRKD